MCTPRRAGGSNVCTLWVVVYANIVSQHQPRRHGNCACERLSPPPALPLHQQGFSPPPSSNAVVGGLKIAFYYFWKHRKCYWSCQTTTITIQPRHGEIHLSLMCLDVLPAGRTGPRNQTLTFVCSWIVEFSRYSFRHEQEVVWLQCTDVRFEAAALATLFPALLLENRAWRHLRAPHLFLALSWKFLFVYVCINKLISPPPKKKNDS